MSSEARFSTQNRKYFTEFTFNKGLLYTISCLYVISVTSVAIFEPLFKLPCDSESFTHLKYDNPEYQGNPCDKARYWILLWLNREECSFARRLVSAVVLGGIIGWERRQADRPAGIRTMSLVSLGSSLFSICSTFAFLTGPNKWDASRISAAIPSGVGFLGAGLIFKENKTSDEDGTSTQVVHGLTTAASLWLSAAVGIACGGELYFAASFGTAIMLLLLRFGPRGSDDDHEDDGEQEMNNNMLQMSKVIDQGSLRDNVAYGTRDMNESMRSERTSLTGSAAATIRGRAKSKAHLATNV